MTPDRLDAISRPNMARVARSWLPVVPDDIPPALNGGPGNVGPGCFGLYVSREGYVRFITRGEQFDLVIGTEHEVMWMAPGYAVELEVNGMRHPVQWLPSVPSSVRVYAQDGAYLYGHIIHVLAHDTTATEMFSLHI